MVWVSNELPYMNISHVLHVGVNVEMVGSREIPCLVNCRPSDGGNSASPKLARFQHTVGAVPRGRAEILYH
ncbi:hypothetical protein ACLOJK_010228 [Asimina triloba]